MASLDEAVAGAAPVARRPTAAHVLWDALTSVRLPIALLLLMALLTLAGTLITQVPPTMRELADPTVYARWLSMMQSRYGSAVWAMDRLHLFDVFNSPWYRAILAILTVSVVCCTIKRVPAIWAGVMSIPQQRIPAFYERADHSASAAVALSAPAAHGAIADAWRAVGYRVVAARDERGTYLYADRYRFGRLFTFVNHLGLISLLAAGALTGVAGQRNDGFVIPEGGTRAVGLGSAIEVRLDDFTDEYFVSGGAKDYRSDVVVYDGGREVARGTIRVNEPLEYGGIVFHQSFFGQAVVMRVTRRGTAIYEDAVPLAYQAFQYGMRPVGFFRLPTENVTVDLVAQENAADALLRPGQVALLAYRPGEETPVFSAAATQRQPLAWGELEFTFVREIQFTGIQAVRDPGAPVFFIAAAAMLVGIIVVFYVPHRRVWALVRPEPAGASVLIAGACPRHPDFASEFAELVAAAEGALSDPAAARRDAPAAAGAPATGRG